MAAEVGLGQVSKRDSAVNSHIRQGLLRTLVKGHPLGVLSEIVLPAMAVAHAAGSAGLWRKTSTRFNGIATAFRGLDTDMGTVQGKYFNKIVADLKAQNKGTHMHQVLSWIMTLHGYLSSPTGGGIRHEADVAALQPLQLHEARLFCNLIRSYVNFLIDEHTRREESRLGRPLSRQVPRRSRVT